MEKSYRIIKVGASNIGGALLIGVAILGLNDRDSKLPAFNRS